MLIVNRRDSKILHTPHGSEIRPLMDRTTSPITQCSLAEELLPPGKSVPPHHHEVLEEVYYILEGSEAKNSISPRRKVIAQGSNAIYARALGRFHPKGMSGSSDLLCGAKCCS